MRIVQQSALVSHCLFPPRLLLPAPRIAGLLPPLAAIVPETPRLNRTRAEVFTEIHDFLVGAQERLMLRYVEIDREVAALRRAYGLPEVG